MEDKAVTHPPLQHWLQNFSDKNLGEEQRTEYGVVFLETLILSAVTYRQCSLQLAGDCAEAVEHKVFTHAVDPLAAGRQSAAHKVTTFPLTGAETPHDLHKKTAYYLKTPGLEENPKQLLVMWRH